MSAYNEIYSSKPIAMNYAEDEEKIWMALLNRNGICEIDKKTKTARICKIFDEEPLDGELLYSHVEKADQKLIFSPCKAKKIAIYNLEDDFMTYIPLEKVEYRCKQNQGDIKFWNIFRNHSHVYLVGYSYPAIVKICMDSMEVTYITDWVEEIETYMEDDDNGGYFADGCVCVGDKALLSVSCTNAVLELNLKTESTRLVKLDVPMEGIGGISSADGENIWIVGKKGKTNKACCWNMRTDKIREYSFSDEDEDIFDPFFAPVCTVSKVYFMPISASGIYEIDIDSGKIQRNQTLELLLKRAGNDSGFWWKILAPKIENNLLIFLTCGDSRWHRYNVITGEFQSGIIYIEENAEDMNQYFDAVYSKLSLQGMIFSERDIPLKYMVNKAIGTEERRPYTRTDELLVGGRIYEQIRRGIQYE